MPDSAAWRASSASCMPLRMSGLFQRLRTQPSFLPGDHWTKVVAHPGEEILKSRVSGQDRGHVTERVRSPANTDLS